MKNLDTICQTLAQMDERTRQAERDLETFHAFIEKFTQIETNLAVLTQYYHSQDWLDDTEYLAREAPELHFYSAGQDPIWNVAQSIYQAKIKLLKQLAQSLDG